jgi:Zn-dependent protease
VLAHELGHAFVALLEKVPVRGITLFIFGGVAQISEEPRSPGAELRIAIAGPLVSLALAASFGAFGLISEGVDWLFTPSMYLARINLMLALFNLIPGFPLDGGRVLRALVWWLTQSYERATRIASASGQVVAFGFIGLGGLSILFGQLANGLWLIFIGWFLQSAASSALQQLKVQQKFSGVTVSQAMSQDCAQVHGLTTLHQLVHGWVLTNGQHCFFVTDELGQTRGMLTLQDITRVPQAQWRFTTAAQAMVPFNRLLKIDVGAELLSALRAMEAANVSQAPVVQQNRPVGLISKDQALRYLRLRTQLGI